jgi:hypothetical protein
VPESVPISKNELVASICRDSFYDFIKRYWSKVITEPMVDNWHIKFLAEELQAVAERVFRKEPKKYDLIINISPGSTKSTIASVSLPTGHGPVQKVPRCHPIGGLSGHF